MKKRSMIFGAAACAVFSLFFAACHSNGAGELYDVPPLALLDTDSSLYMGIPAKTQKNSAVTMLTAALPSLGKADAAKLVERCNVIYAGVSTVQEKSRMQVAIDGSFPAVGIKSALTEKNGWQKETRTYKNAAVPLVTTVYRSASHKGMEIAVPNSGLLCAGSEVDAQLEKFAAAPQSAPDTDAFRWVQDPSDGIRFFVTDPGKYLRALIGAPVELSIENTYGTLHGGDDGTFTMNFYAQLKTGNAFAMRAMLSLIKLSFGMMGADVEQQSDTLIYVTGLELSSEQIAQIFNLQS